jgi:mono/diheme cytochrome c family protein
VAREVYKRMRPEGRQNCGGCHESTAGGKPSSLIASLKKTGPYCRGLALQCLKDTAGRGL